MTRMLSMKSTAVLLAIAFSFSSCEGFKILTLYNKTKKEIVIETRPQLPHFKHTSLNDTIQNLAASKIYRLLPDSSLPLLITFGGLLFYAKIKEQDLPIDYIKIETSIDTIVANNRSEIIKLIKSPALKYKLADKSFAWDNNKNIEAIIVRQ